MFDVGWLGTAPVNLLQKVLDYWCMMLYYLVMGSTEPPETKGIEMTKFNIFHTERNTSAGLPYGHPGMNDTRAEGPVDGFATKADAAQYMGEMQAQARADGHPEYADALHIQAI